MSDDSFDKRKMSIPYDLITDNSLSVTSRIVCIAILYAREYFETKDIPENSICQSIGLSSYQYRTAMKQINKTDWLK